MLVDLEQRQAGMLLVVRAETAIVGTAVFGPGVELERHVARLQEIAAPLPVARLARDQRLLDAVLGATLQVKDRLPFLDDLRRDEPQAGLAHRGGLAEEDVRARFACRRDGGTGCRFKDG